MKNPDDQDIDPDDIFEELEPTEPESLDARVRNGEGGGHRQGGHAEVC